MTNNPEQALLEQARHFETQALEEIFDRYSPGIYRYAFRLLGDTELARECMSETFSRFLSTLKRDGGPDNYLQAYLYRIAHNWITDQYRSKVPPSIPLDSVMITDPAAEPHQVVTRRMESQQVRDALTLLTPDQRQVIVLKYLEDWDNKAIAQTMNKPIGAVKALQHRAIDSLHRIISRYEEIKV